MLKLVGASLAVVFYALAPSVAHADPCTAPLPSHAGDTFSGAVRYVGDGDGLCVGRSTDPSTWIEVRLGDFDAPELHAADGPRSKRFLEQVAMGREVTCSAVQSAGGADVSSSMIA